MPACQLTNCTNLAAPGYLHCAPCTLRRSLGTAMAFTIAADEVGETRVRGWLRAAAVKQKAEQSRPPSAEAAAASEAARATAEASMRETLRELAREEAERGADAAELLGIFNAFTSEGLCTCCGAPLSARAEQYKMTLCFPCKKHWDRRAPICEGTCGKPLNMRSVASGYKCCWRCGQTDVTKPCLRCGKKATMKAHASECGPCYAKSRSQPIGAEQFAHAQSALAEAEQVQATEAAQALADAEQSQE